MSAANGDEPPQPLDEIEVTGSHIRDVDLQNQHPVLIIDRAAIERTGLSSIADIVQEIVANGPTLNRNIGSGNGEQLANLRSLGFNRTLVLLNSQRFVADVGGAVDLSVIPLALVERVEVLLDGASAIYGSDAIAGVINIITRRNYDGGELSAYFGQTNQDDGQRRAYALSLGRKADAWSASGGIEYTRDDPVFAGNRAISAVPLFGLPPGATGSGFTPYSWLVPDSALSSCGFCPLRLIDGRPGTSASDFRLVDFATDLFNYQQSYNYLQTPQERRAAFGQGRFEVSSTLALSLDALYSQRTSAQHLAPPNLIVRRFSANHIAISADDVYNPFNEPIDIAFRRMVEAGPRIFDETDDTARVRAGADGAFSVLQRDFTWNVDALATRSATRQFTGPYADDRKLAPALGPSFVDAAGVAHCGAPDAVIAGCVPLNLFGPPGSITPAMLDYIDAFEINRERDTSHGVVAQIDTRELFALPAGAVGFAAGLGRRHESGGVDEDPLDAGGYANGNGETSASTHGGYGVSEAYLEFDVPLLADRALARKLDLTAGSRYSKYSSFGAKTTSQFGLRWKPVDDLLVRANHAQGFRAPAITELFQGAVQSNGFFNDPCDPKTNPSPTVQARCASLGVPANVSSPPFVVGLTSVGNPNLEPETAVSRGAGFVYTPSWAEGFTASLDWYDIELRNAIADTGVDAVIFDCYTRHRDFACTLIERDPVDGTITHVTDMYQNLPGGVETAGYDLAATYRRETPVGQFALHLNANYVDYYGEIGKPSPGATLPDGSSAQGNIVGLNSISGGYFGVIWRWRAQLQLAWDSAPWSASITARYFSHIDEDCSAVTNTASDLGQPAFRALCSNPDHSILIAGNLVPENQVASVTFTDFQGSWDAPWHARVTLGVRNAFDRTPPVAYSISPFFADYDLPGRFFYLSYRQTFP